MPSGNAPPFRFQWRRLGEPSSSPAFLLSLKPARPRQRKKGERGGNHRIILLIRVGFVWWKHDDGPIPEARSAGRPRPNETSSRLFVPKLERSTKGLFTLPIISELFRWCDCVASVSTTASTEDPAVGRYSSLFHGEKYRVATRWLMTATPNKGSKGDVSFKIVRVYFGLYVFFYSARNYVRPFFKCLIK